MTQIQAAVEALRTSREALPAEPQHPWERVGHKGLSVGVPNPERRGAYSSASGCDNDDPEDAEVAEYIALVASPDRVHLLERLLEAIHEHDQADDQHSWETCFIGIREHADALAAAITRRTP